MRWRAIGALVGKDLLLFSRSRFFALITVLGLVAYVLVYFLLPRDVDETIEFAVYADPMPPALERIFAEGGVELVTMESEAALRQAILDGDVMAGMVLPADLLAQIAAGGRPVVHVYLSAESPPEMRDIYHVLVEGLALALSGNRIRIHAEEEILGPDMSGEQIAPRDRMVPLLVVFALMMEMMSLSSLLAEEIQVGTIRALLITPLSTLDFFVGKGIMGVGLAFIEAALLMAFIGGLARAPLLILVALLLGAVLATAIGFLIASVARDMMSVLAWSIPMIIMLAVPPFGVLFPGTVTGWAKAIPSYYLTSALYQVIGEAWPSLLVLLAFDLLLLGAGVFALKRRFA